MEPANGCSTASSWPTAPSSIATARQNCENGERIYQERLPNARSVAASPWIAGDTLFALDESGQTFVLKTGRRFKAL